MRLPNTSRLKISKILADALEQGIYHVPHVLHDLPISGGDFSVLLALFKLQDDFLKRSKHYGGWFYATSTLISKSAKRHPSTVKRATSRLKFMGLIDYRKGAWLKRRATEYRILIDSFYLAASAKRFIRDIHKDKNK